MSAAVRGREKAFMIGEGKRGRIPLTATLFFKKKKPQARAAKV
jgi:hypothetical protein